MTTQRLSTPPSEARNRPVTPWWVDAVIYQVYPRSFADADGDGMGDLRGVTSRLDYLDQLGVDAIWLSPFYLSPQHDAGYDVADYRAVDPRFGTLADADEMIAAAHEAGIRVVVDLVPNHTSSEHAWFQAALAAGPGSPERARYHFDYAQLRADLKRVRAGLEDYLVPQRAQPRDPVPLAGDYVRHDRADDEEPSP